MQCWGSAAARAAWVIHASSIPTTQSKINTLARSPRPARWDRGSTQRRRARASTGARGAPSQIEASADTGRAPQTHQHVGA